MQDVICIRYIDILNTHLYNHMFSVILLVFFKGIIMLLRYRIISMWMSLLLLFTRDLCISRDSRDEIHRHPSRSK